MRPGRADMTTTRSARKIASEIEWVTKAIVLRVSIQIAWKSGFISSRVKASSASKRSSIGDRERLTARLLHAVGKLNGLAAELPFQIIARLHYSPARYALSRLGVQIQSGLTLLPTIALGGYSGEGPSNRIPNFARAVKLMNAIAQPGLRGDLEQRPSLPDATRRTAAAYWLLIALHLAPILVFPIPRSAGLVNHWARLTLMNMAPSDPLNAFYEFKLRVIPNLALDLAYIALAPIVSPHAMILAAWIASIARTEEPARERRCGFIGAHRPLSGPGRRPTAQSPPTARHE